MVVKPSRLVLYYNLINITRVELLLRHLIKSENEAEMLR